MDTKPENQKLMNNWYKNIFLAILLNLSFTAGAEITFQTTTDTLPLDSSIRYGRLPNGFTYYIKSIPSPQSKIYLRLFNKAGSNQEDNDQLNIAHAVEHMAFKSSKNFPLGIRNSDRMDKLDMRKYDFSGSSGRKMTQYYFNAPHGSTEALNLGLLWFKDIISGLNLSVKDIDQVRGELRQEFLGNAGDLNKNYAEKSMYAQIFPCNKENSHFLKHHATFEPETLRRFYKEWYRTDLMALSIVGNIKDPDELERQIKDRFSNINSPEEPKKTPDCDAEYYSRSPQFANVLLDSNRSESVYNEVKFHLFFRAPVIHKKLNSIEGIKRLIKLQLLIAAANERFKQATNEYQSFSVFGRDSYVYSELPPSMEVDITMEKGQEKKALNKSIRVLYQLEKYGILEEEWAKSKQKQIEFLNSQNEVDPEYWIKEIEKYYQYGEALPANKLGLLKEWMANYSLPEFNNFISQFLSKGPDDIGIIGSNGYKELSYTEKELRGWIEDAYGKTMKPYISPIAPIDLIKPVEVKKLQEVKLEDKGTGSSGAREVVLDNGVTVIFKSFTSGSGSQGKRINLHGFSLKGASSFSKGNYFSAINAPAIVRNAGVNGLDKFQLNRFLSKISLNLGSVSPYVDYQESGIYGNGALNDLEYLLQLIYLYFTSPNKDKIAFEDWKINEYKAYKNPSYNLISMDFSNSIRSLTGDASFSSVLGKRAPTGTKRYESIEQTSFEEAYQVYKKIFGNAKDFSFLISGDFEIQTILPLVQKYLGNLPNLSETKEVSTRTLEVKKIHEGPSYIKIPAPGEYEMKNVNYGVQFIKKAKNLFDWQEQLKVEALGGITNKKAWALRFEKGYSLYDIGVAGQFNEDLNRYEIRSDFECVPEEFQKIRKEFKQIISDIKSGLITKEEFQQGLSRMYFQKSAKNANQPRVMQEKLYKHYRYGQLWIDPAVVESYIKSLTVEDIVKTANTYYADENFYEFVMTSKKME